MFQFKHVIFVLLYFSAFNTNAQSTQVISNDWIAFRQTINVETKVKKKFKVTASVMVETDDEKAWAGIWARVDEKTDEVGFFDNMGDRPITSNIWQSYTVEGTIDENSKLINFGGLCKYNGKFYFDKFELFIENAIGVFEPFVILNPGFETPMINGELSKWDFGIQRGKNIKAREYKVALDKNAFSGKSSLLLEGSGIVIKERGKIGNIEGASPQIGAMISMLEDLKDRVDRTVKNMNQYEVDYLHDEKANRIGSLIMHLAAAEKYYQVLTFENREFTSEEEVKWGAALNLDQEGRDEWKGKDVQYYLDIYNEVRNKTIEELKRRNDEWFNQLVVNEKVTNHYCWFHVMEHQSSHLGQILFLKKRIPPEKEVILEQKIKD